MACELACTVIKSLSLTPWDALDCSPPGSSSIGFSGQEYWSGLPCPSSKWQVRGTKCNSLPIPNQGCWWDASLLPAIPGSTLRRNSRGSDSWNACEWQNVNTKVDWSLGSYQQWIQLSPFHSFISIIYAFSITFFFNYMTGMVMAN